MTSRIFFHYILAFTLLLASSFAVFHSSEHIAIGKMGSVSTDQAHKHGEHVHAESVQQNFVHQDMGAPELPTKHHSVELLCEAYILLSGLSACGLNYCNLLFLPEKTKRNAFNLVHSIYQPFQTYLSRAPPSKV